MIVRRPAVAGTFYPGDPRALRAAVDALLRAAAPAPAGEPPPPAIVVPHAGYVYSGPVAASAYARLAPGRGRVRRAVILGPAHHVLLEGLALSGADAFRTPLGDVPIDRPACARVAALPGVVVDDRAHADEHSLEVQLPFLQCVLDDPSIVPLVVGRCEPSLVARVLDEFWLDEFWLDEFWGDPQTVVIVSTDLSHYEEYEAAARHDRSTADAIAAGRVDAIGPPDACGMYPLRGLLAAANARALAPRLLDLRSSGDTAGPRDRVVGYAAFSLVPAGA